MKSKVTLLARIPLDGKYPYIRVPFRRNHPQPVEQATYYLRFSRNGQRIVRSVGKDLTVAFAQFQNEQTNQIRASIGLLEAPSNRIKLADAVSEYIEELEQSVKMGKKSRKTFEAYTKAVRDFAKQSKVEYVGEITGPVLKAHERWLFEQLPKRIYGKKSNTISGRFRFLSVFLSKQGIRMAKRRNGNSTDEGLLDWQDVPRNDNTKKIDKYSETEINNMLSVASIDEADLIHTFLRTGMRDEEVAYLCWLDIDFHKKQITVNEKPQYNWRPKDKEERTIPLEDGVLLKRLAARKERQSPKSDLVFPSTVARPDMHLIKRFKNVVDKMRQKELEIEGVPTLHRFRRTYASMMIGQTDLQTVSALLGHSDIKTTARYLAPDQQKARVGSRTAFSQIGD